MSPFLVLISALFISQGFAQSVNHVDQYFKQATHLIPRPVPLPGVTQRPISFQLALGINMTGALQLKDGVVWHLEDYLQVGDIEQSMDKGVPTYKIHVVVPRLRYDFEYDVHFGIIQNHGRLNGTLLGLKFDMELQQSPISQKYQLKPFNKFEYSYFYLNFYDSTQSKVTDAILDAISNLFTPIAEDLIADTYIYYVGRVYTAAMNKAQVLING